MGVSGFGTGRVVTISSKLKKSFSQLCSPHNLHIDNKFQICRL
uniref:Protein pleiotropic regulatory locus 1 n=1 Tax=Rhizophora mucronata TaxID=61149 RepID=A0A2P2J1U1_RHIMU